MAKLKYIVKDNNNPYTIEHRLQMCEAFDEGCELTGVVRKLTSSARILYGLEDDYNGNIVLTIVEKMCREYCKNFLWRREADWEEYNEFPEEVYKHFTGGARKLTEEEYHQSHWMDRK